MIKSSRDLLQHLPHKLCNSISCILFLFIISCTAPSNNYSDADFTYTPLHVGDVHQIVNVADSFTILDSIAGKTFRKDGQEVFVTFSKAGTGNSPYAYDTGYCFVRGSFLISTDIDTVKDTNGVLNDSTNVYLEFKEAMVKPIDGYKWVYIPLPYRSFHRENYQGAYQTFADMFNETFGVGFYWYEPIYEKQAALVDYYGKNIGWIGTEAFDSTGVMERQLKLSYAKIDGVEYGTLFPAKDPALAKMAKQKNLKHNIIPHYLMAGAFVK